MVVSEHLQVVRNHLKSVLRMLLLTMNGTFSGVQIFVRLLKAEFSSNKIERKRKFLFQFF